ncbi:RimJ/RimL family protein N-acetyltransferase [Crossiella equi]|uniref:RimJ/RimL family protein N-acetyltransferase n=1 Tax=Crossiella equi TaxID=130796 RepID=A0ABS5A5I6_9PSEU|nr:GNAT family N-acetyltransferase [Crossiella equi]MBP2471561.1 RimJ/RimL family protein N-acetyltransferase [Crossiella equi]
MADSLTTERLVLSAPRPEDLPEVIALHGDPEVMRFLEAPQSPERAEELFRTWLLPPERGFWTARLRDTGAFVGWFALEPAGADPGVVELGYRLTRASWGRGYGTEGSVALVDKVFREHTVHTVTANTMAVNSGSRRVLEKTGLRHVRTFHLEWADPLPGTEHGEVEYRLTREQWAAARTG